MRVSFHPDYEVPLPSGHPFPMAKYRLLRDRLIARGLVPAAALMKPREASFETLELVHTAAYLEALATGALPREAERLLGMPLTPALWRRSRLATQGTINAAVTALRDGIGANLAGGTHHAFADHGEGFCVLNDVAIAIRWLQERRLIRRALVVDLDVHQGNGTAAIFAGDDSVFTLSIHGETNYPARKMRSTVDVGLPDGTPDDGYLAALDRHLPAAIASAGADVAFYLAGVDPVQGDRYGRLSLSEAGLAERERFVLRSLQSRALPTVIVLAGGYARTAERTAELHALAFEAAAAL
jgi:acetoin utilization deacetylase AcuC-like enzyme